MRKNKKTTKEATRQFNATSNQKLDIDDYIKNVSVRYNEEVRTLTPELIAAVNERCRELGLGHSVDMKVLVTPENAKRILEEGLNSTNRTIRDANIAHIEQAMLSDTFNGDGLDYIATDKNGKLYSGQHRLYAIAKSGKPQYLNMKLYRDRDLNADGVCVANSVKDLAKINDIPYSGAAVQSIQAILYLAMGRHNGKTRKTQSIGNPDKLNVLQCNIKKPINKENFANAGYYGQILFLGGKLRNLVPGGLISNRLFGAMLIAHIAYGVKYDDMFDMLSRLGDSQYEDGHGRKAYRNILSHKFATRGSDTVAKNRFSAANDLGTYLGTLALLQYIVAYAKDLPLTASSNGEKYEFPTSTTGAKAETIENFFNATEGSDCDISENGVKEAARKTFAVIIENADISAKNVYRAALEKLGYEI